MPRSGSAATLAASAADPSVRSIAGVTLAVLAAAVAAATVGQLLSAIVMGKRGACLAVGAHCLCCICTAQPLLHASSRSSCVAGPRLACCVPLPLINQAAAAVQSAVDMITTTVRQARCLYLPLMCPLPSPPARAARLPGPNPYINSLLDSGRMPLACCAWPGMLPYINSGGDGNKTGGGGGAVGPTSGGKGTGASSGDSSKPGAAAAAAGGVAAAEATAAGAATKSGGGNARPRPEASLLSCMPIPCFSPWPFGLSLMPDDMAPRWVGVIV